MIAKLTRSDGGESTMHLSKGATAKDLAAAIRAWEEVHASKLPGATEDPPLYKVKIISHIIIEE